MGSKMKQLIIATLGIFLFGCSSSLPERCETKAPSISSDTRKKNGQQWECNKDGGWKLIGQWKEDKYEGKWTLWYDNGQKQWEENYKNGKLEGKRTTWYDNGQKESEGYHKNGKQKGKWTFWDKDGVKTQ
jgi:antitoxin component YwqK of YwqJK toxin-antitoxin module